MEFHQNQGRLTEVDKPEGLFRIAFIERKHKRRIMNFEELVASCNMWQLPEGTRYKKVECWAINLDDSHKYLENLSQLRSVDALVSFWLSTCCDTQSKLVWQESSYLAGKHLGYGPSQPSMWLSKTLVEALHCHECVGCSVSLFLQ